MSKTVQINIDHLATLARLALTPDEKSKFAAQLVVILEHIEQLKQVNIEGVEPTAHATPIFNVLQPDEPSDALSQQEALRNAPAQRENMVAVPRVVE